MSRADTSRTKGAGGLIVNGLLNAQMPADELRLRMGELDAEQILAVRSAIAWANRVAVARFASTGASSTVEQA